MRVQATAHPRLVRGATSYGILMTPSSITRDDDAPETWEADIETAGVMLRGDTPEVPGGTLIVEAYAGEEMVRSGSGSPGGMNITIGRDITEVRARLMVAGAQVAARSLVVEVNRKGEPGKDGEDGEDAISITLTPAQILLPLTGKATQTFFSVNATKGTKEVAIGGLLPVGTVIPVAGVAASISATPPGYVIRHDGKTPVNGYFEITVQIDGVDHKRRVQLGTYEVPTGPTGAVIRVTEWQPDTDFKDGETEDTDADGKLTGIRYLDIATRDGNAWQCIKSHTSTPGNYGAGNPTGCPTTTMPDGKNTYWRQLSKTNPIYTPLLLADNARINFMSGQEIVISGTTGNVVARLGTPTNGIMMWAGGPGSAQDAAYTLDINGRTTYGNGARSIVLDPNAATMEYKIGNSVVASYEGNVYAGPMGVRGEDIIKSVTPALSSPLLMSTRGDNKTASGRVKVGTVNLGIHDRPLKISVPVKASAQSHYMPSGGGVSVWHTAGVTVKMFLKCVDGSEEGTEIDCTAIGGSVHTIAPGQSSTKKEETVMVDCGDFRPDPRGIWEVYIDYSLTLSPASPNDAMCWAALNIYPGITVYPVVEEEYCAKYYANGNYVGQSCTDYVMSWRDDANSCICFESLCGGVYGISVTHDGVRVSDGNGWITLSDFIDARVEERIDDLIDARLKTLGLLT